MLNTNEKNIGHFSVMQIILVQGVYRYPNLSHNNKVFFSLASLKWLQKRQVHNVDPFFTSHHIQKNIIFYIKKDSLPLMMHELTSVLQILRPL